MHTDRQTRWWMLSLTLTLLHCGDPLTVPSSSATPSSLPPRSPVEALVGPGTLCPEPTDACWNWKVQGPSRAIKSMTTAEEVSR